LYPLMKGRKEGRRPQLAGERDSRRDSGLSLTFYPIVG